MVTPLLLACLLTAPRQAQAKKPPAKPAPKAAPKTAAKDQPPAKPAEPTPLERAKKALDARDYAEASKILTEYLAANPGKEADDAPVWFQLGFAATELGERAKAADAYEKALALDPKLFAAQLNLSILLLGDNRYADALPHLKAAVELKPAHARASALYAAALARTGDRAAARKFYDASLEADANQPSTLAGSGILAIEEKNFPLAERQLTRARELNPADPSATMELARVYELSGHRDRAAEMYRALLKENPGLGNVHRRLGQILVEQKKTDEAIAEFELAEQAAPSPEDDWNLARAYAAARKPDLALPKLAALRQREPNNYEVLLLTGQMLNLKREFAAAQGALQMAVRIDPKIPDAYVELANAMYLQERYPETVQVLDVMKARAEKVTETPWSTFLRAISLDKLRQEEGAIVSYKRFLAIAGGKYPDQEFQARQRVKALTISLEKKGKRVP